MRYIKIILTIIAVLLALNIVKSMFPSATASSVTDVNLVQLAGKKLGGVYNISSYARVAISVRIVD